ncbi:UNVERIFIED_CONTAM: hypothetical protein Slati_1954800 [Sesamum latifolium]|uniref:PGG domain-containing protein n=1 Tax=Sesamum latifolium TaxID=2727402 RepID=A0AAW2WNG2_9LAMI
MGNWQSKIVMKWKDENITPMQSGRFIVFSSPAREKYFSQHVPLHKAALKGEWEAAEKLLSEDRSLAKASITEGGETALHVAALEGHSSFVANLLDRMEASDLEIQNNKGSTALCFAAAAGHVDIAKLLVEKNPKLPTISGFEGVTPLYMAVLQAHSEMADYLFSLPAFEFWTTDHQIALLTTAIDSGLYGLAMSIVDQHKTLAVIEDSNGETPLQVLARKPSAFCGSSEQGLCTTILSYMKLKTHKNSVECDAYKLLGYLWDSVISQEDVETAQIVGNTSKLFFIAAESGNDEFLVELIRRYPDFLYKVNESKHSIFHIAVVRRYVRVFNLMHELVGVKELIATYIDKDGNNMLHLAAKLSPQNQLNSIPGAALQMQREVLWYKEVEKIVQPLYRDMKNKAGQTPYDIFLAEHENLMKEGEKLMKQTAKSCMLVTMLIATVVFTTAFTVPGGYNNNTGAPILQNEKVFMVFPISEAVATLSSLTSMLMFLAILTSRYTEKDFVNSLPFWLVIGVGALFISIMAMMVAFCTCLLSYEHGLVAATALLAFFASVPIMFIILKYELLVTVLRSTYGCRWLFRSNNRLFS